MDIWLVSDWVIAVEALKTGSCWCEMGIGNPMVREHSTSCVAVKELVDKARSFYGGAIDQRKAEIQCTQLLREANEIIDEAEKELDSVAGQSLPRDRSFHLERWWAQNQYASPSAKGHT